MANVVPFSMQDEEILINLVAQRPFLYDLSCTDYRNSYKRDKVWKEIGKELNKSGKVCKNRWKNIKDTYYRQKKKLNGSTGSAANPRSKFGTYREQLSFLETIPQERTSITNISEESRSSSDRSHVASNTETPTLMDSPGPSGVPCDASPNVSETPESPTAETQELLTKTPDPTLKPPQNVKKNRKKQDDIMTYLEKRDATRQQIIGSVLSSNQGEEDEIDSFTKHANSVLKKLPPYLQITAMQEIFETLTKYKMRAVEATRFERSPTPIMSSGSDTRASSAEAMYYQPAPPTPSSNSNSNSNQAADMPFVGNAYSPRSSTSQFQRSQTPMTSSASDIRSASTEAYGPSFQQTPTSVSNDTSHQAPNILNNVYSPISPASQYQDEAADLSLIRVHDLLYDYLLRETRSAFISAGRLTVTLDLVRATSDTTRLPGKMHLR